MEMSHSVSHSFFILFKLEPEKKSWKIKSQNDRTLFPETFYFTDFLVPKFWNSFPKTFFQRTFLAVIYLIQASILLHFLSIPNGIGVKSTFRAMKIHLMCHCEHWQDLVYVFYWVLTSCKYQ